MSPSPKTELPAGDAPGEGDSTAWPLLPTETEIYILPDGRVVVADLPAELAPLVAALGSVEPCEIDPDAQPDSPV